MLRLSACIWDWYYWWQVLARRDCDTQSPVGFVFNSTSALEIADTYEKENHYISLVPFIYFYDYVLTSNLSSSVCGSGNASLWLLWSKTLLHPLSQMAALCNLVVSFKHRESISVSLISLYHSPLPEEGIISELTILLKLCPSFCPLVSYFSRS